MGKLFRLSHFCVAIVMSTVSFGLAAQQVNPATTKATPEPVTPKLPYQPIENMFELPAGVLQSLSLEAKQKELLDKAHIARRQLWSAMRKARLDEYAALTKALDKDVFDPKEVISLRKKIRAAADKRMDDVQSVWMDFWESLNPVQRKTLVAYMKQQHVQNANISKVRAAKDAEERAARAAQEKAANSPAQSK